MNPLSPEALLLEVQRYKTANRQHIDRIDELETEVARQTHRAQSLAEEANAATVALHHTEERLRSAADHNEVLEKRLRDAQAATDAHMQGIGERLIDLFEDLEDDVLGHDDSEIRDLVYNAIGLKEVD